jgi:coenzyme F420 hydrogenase subunit delta
MIREMFDKTILVFGVGSILWGDDGFGPAVVNYLNEHYQLPQDVLALDVGTSIRDLLFDLILSEKKPQKILVLDAVEYPDRRPGEIFEIPVEGIPEKKTADFSLHQFPTVNMLQELQDHSAIEVKVIVVQADELPEEVQPGLSPAVAAAVPRACELIMSQIKMTRH